MATFGFVTRADKEGFNFSIEKLTIRDSIFNQGEIEGSCVIANLLYESFLKENDLKIGTFLCLDTFFDNYEFAYLVEITSYQFNGKFLTIFFKTPQPLCIEDKGYFNSDIKAILKSSYENNINYYLNEKDNITIPYIFISKDRSLKKTINSLSQLSNTEFTYYLNLDNAFILKSIDKLTNSRDYTYTLEFNEQGQAENNKIRVISFNLFTNNIMSDPSYHFWSFDFNKYVEDESEIKELTEDRREMTTANYEVFDPLLNNEFAYRQKTNIQNYNVERAIIEILGWSNGLSAGNNIKLILYPKGYNDNYKPENNKRQGIYLIEKSTRILIEKGIASTILIVSRRGRWNE